MNRDIFYSSIKNKLIKIGFVQIFLGLSEMVNILIIYKIIVYSLESIQNNQKDILIKLGSYYDFNMSFIKICYLSVAYIVYSNFI